MLTGLLVAGEALALLIGIHLLSKGSDPWVSRKNDLLLGLDMLVGLGLIAVVLATRNPVGAPPLCLLAGLGLLTHLYRDWEYASGARNPFCANPPLFIVNNLKIAGLAAVLLLATGSWCGQVEWT